MSLNQRIQHQAAHKLEHALGDPNNPDSIMSYKRVMELDEQESFQEEFYQYLLSLKTHHHYVPAALGGKFETYEQLYALGKVLARRDLSTAVTMSTMIWSTLVWVGGDKILKQHCADVTLSNNGAQCLAYSEEHHGSDLLANELTATEVEDGFILEGEKWPINRAARSEVVMLLARTANESGGRNLSLFFVEKSKIDCSTFTYISKVKTHGLRGCDICGIKFNKTHIPKSALIGPIGGGLEIAIKAFQVTRTLCASLSIGALENNLRVVMGFATQRRLYKGNVFDIPNARHHLTNAFTDLLITDALGSSLSRALHVIPKQFSVLSAVAKCFAPYKLDQAQKDLATVLGARFFFREKHKEGIFQKSLRDSQVVSLFDGSSEINLYSLTTQLSLLARRQDKLFAITAETTSSKLSNIFDASTQLPTFRGEKLDLSSHGRDLIMESWPQIIAALKHASGTLHNADKILFLAEMVFNKHQQNLQRIANHVEQKSDMQSPRMFKIAREYCVVHAAVCSIQYWLNNTQNSDVFINKADWLIVGLQRLLLELNIDIEISEQHLTQVSNELLHRSQAALSYGLVPLELPELSLIPAEEIA
ncbi:acyl-CoA dehydrogenase [Algibacillus agarilyticus]|uniref:acyl-CoA dehydrogenase n=1 Tax=Algibacillus agarilyticus TaxID=2234133 RepID=UPI000DD08E5B|nr:acyl-CoA dehydrogenase [Algibacillus agarilyticus]